MRRIPPTLVLSLAAAAATASLLLGPVRGLRQPASGFHLPWPALAGLFAASVVLRVHLQFRREVHSVTLMEVPLVLGLHLVNPASMVLARLAGSLPALVIHSRQRGRKLLFNLALFGLEACVAVLIFAWLLAGRAPVGTVGLVAPLGRSWPPIWSADPWSSPRSPSRKASWTGLRLVRPWPAGPSPRSPTQAWPSPWSCLRPTARSPGCCWSWRPCCSLPTEPTRRCGSSMSGWHGCTMSPGCWPALSDWARWSPPS